MSADGWVRTLGGLLLPTMGFANQTGLFQPCVNFCGSGWCANCRPSCCGVRIAGTYRITFFGLQNNTCSDCGDLNSPTSFIVTLNEIGARCNFTYTAAGDPCNLVRVKLFFDKTVPTSPQEYVAAVFLTEPGGNHVFKKIYFDELIPCCTKIRADWSSDEGSPTQCHAVAPPTPAHCEIEPII